MSDGPLGVIRGWTPDPQRLLWISVAVACGTIGLKGLAWWLTGSVGLLSDAMESLVNLATAFFALAMVGIARRPADADHPHGHHKAEYFAGAVEGLLILFAAAAIIWAATGRLFAPQPLTSLGLGLSLTVLASMLNGALAWVMLKSAKVHRSMALEGEARHLLVDVWTSVGVLGGLVLVALSGWLWLDALLAIAVALNIAREGGRLVWESVQGLMDAALEPELQERIEHTLEEFSHPRVRFDHVATRRAGSRCFVYLHMHMPGTWSLGRAAAIRKNVEQALMSAVPGLRVTIELLPLDAEAHVDPTADDLFPPGDSTG